MARFGDFLDKQGRSLLDNDAYALTCTAVLAAMPYTAWISASIIALLTLRKGWKGSLKSLMVGIFAFAVFQVILNNIAPESSFFLAFLTFVPVYVAALGLNLTGSWRITYEFIIGVTLLVVGLTLLLAPDFVTRLFSPFHELMKSVEQEMMTGSSNNKTLKLDIISDYYLMGIWVFATVIWSSFSSVLLARYVQSRIFYPGGLRKEMLNFRASVFAVVILVTALIGAYLGNHWAMACLPVLVAYFVCASLSVSFFILKKGRGIFTLIILVLPIMFIPYVILPVYTMLGAMDSLFNIRSHLSSNSDVK